MNQHVLQGKWKEVRGGLKKQWGKLTDDDVRRIQGSLDQIAGIIQQRYGYTKERAEREIDEYLDIYNNQMRNYSERMKAYGNQLNEYGEQLLNYNEDMRSRVRNALEEASHKVRSQESATKPRKRSGRTGGFAILSGLALFALVFYLFNRQERNQLQDNKQFGGPTQ